ncbi:hypothetical protein OG897_16315 [Streptomyces sp. NBC_00237]|uniref:hypothetical protein n=1 Tax=Streptomyces sp. NBC_00237 TaxID=2975687 RepID=UPI00224FF5A3|nr:hypothetical protein [Streptomyces sp. NBC_00237]MCX5203006.1 hypothetical protein [Streptomyces sp. NBC_00237]
MNSIDFDRLQSLEDAQKDPTPAGPGVPVELWGDIAFRALHPDMADRHEFRDALRVANSLVRSEAGGIEWQELADKTVPTLVTSGQALTPDQVRTLGIVVDRLAFRALDNPSGVTQETAGDASYTQSPSQGMGLRLTANERREIRRAAGLSRTRTLYVSA